MLINCYYYAPHNHCLLNEYIERDLERMAGLGTDAVSFCLQEGQMDNWHQQRVRNMVDRIHAHGMQAHAVPNRWAGLVAGWLDGFGRFTLENPDTLICDKGGVRRPHGEMVSCVNHPKVIEHIRDSVSKMFKLFDFDGLIWDEPHSRVCHCEHCTALNPKPTEEWSHVRFASFIDEMSLHAKQQKAGAIISLFTQPHQGKLLKALLKTEHVEYLGSDGHIRSNDHQMHRMKGTIFQAHEEFAPMLRQANKKTFFLLEAQRHRDEDLENYLENLDQAFNLPMDHRMYYYSAHEMSPNNETIFNKATWSAVKRISESRK